MERVGYRRPTNTPTAEASPLSFSSAGGEAGGSSDQVGLVDHACGLAAADGDEYALVQPVKSGRGGLDVRRRAEDVFARIDMLTPGEPGEDLGAAVAYRARLDVDQVSAVGLQGVADVAECGAVRQDDLPVGA